MKLFVTLEVFDSLGREVSQLVSGEMLPGTYSRQWSAEGLASGTYFFRMQAGSYIETKKLVLAKSPATGTDNKKCKNEQLLC